MSAAKTTISLANTPVRRALARAKRSSLVILFVLGLVFGGGYKIWFQEQPVSPAPPAAAGASRN